MEDAQATWLEFYCGKCGHEEAFFGELPDEYEFHCNCADEEDK